MTCSNQSVMCVVGTRPEVIKMAPVIHALQAAAVDTTLVDTGQHRELAQEALAGFGLTADVRLSIMSAGQTPTGVAALVLERLAPVLEHHRPDWLVVQGDTTTVLAAAIAGAYHRIPVAHVEAGLRSNRLDQPFPEEINRRVATTVSSLHFAPTARAVEALRAEGVPADRVLLTGNTVIDALHWACANLPDRPIEPSLAGVDPERPLILLTTHRRENFGGGLAEVFRAVRTIADQRPELQFLFPVHPNPAVRDAVGGVLGDVPAVILTEPLGYLDLAWALQRCGLVLTDSGGLQEEAPALGKQVIVLREVTERPEAVDAGMAHLVGTDHDRIVRAVLGSLDQPPPMACSPYGDGHAGQRIADAIQGRAVSPFAPPGSNP